MANRDDYWMPGAAGDLAGLPQTLLTKIASF
jgi:hypothetical protein